MKHWKTELRSGTEKPATVMIKRGIFPLLFVVGLIPLTHILWKEKAGLCFGNGSIVKRKHGIQLEKDVFLGNLSLNEGKCDSLQSKSNAICN